MLPPTRQWACICFSFILVLVLLATNVSALEEEEDGLGGHNQSKAVHRLQKKCDLQAIEQGEDAGPDDAGRHTPDESLAPNPVTHSTQAMLKIVSEAIEPSRSHLVMRDLIVIFFYSLVMLVSLFGNLVVIKVILFRQAMRKRITNVFIANLTISDIIVTIFTIPMNIARTILDNWPFGESLCKLVPFVQALSVYVSALSMTMIAIDRYQALVRPLQNRVSHRVPRWVLISAIWIVSAILSLPYGAFNRLTTYDVSLLIAHIKGEPIYRCGTSFNALYNRLLTLFQFTTQYLVPLVIVAMSYTAIGLKISKRVCIGETTLEQVQTHLNAKRKTIKMLMFVVAVFAICWLPYHLMFILQDFFDFNFTLSFQYAIKWLGMSSICYNPFIYFWLNNGYRQGILNALTCCACTGPNGGTLTLNSSLVNATNGHQLNGRPHASASMARTSSARSTLSNLAMVTSTLYQQQANKTKCVACRANDKNNNIESNDVEAKQTSSHSQASTSHHLQIIYISLNDNNGHNEQGGDQLEDEDGKEDDFDSDIEERPRDKRKQMLNNMINTQKDEDKAGQHFDELIELVKHSRAQHEFL